MAVPRHAPSPETAPRPPLRVVPDGYRTPRARRRRARLLGFLGAALVALCLFGVVAFHVLLTQGQLQLERLQTQEATAAARNERLQLEVAQLESPERIVAAAQQQLGMVPPPGVTYLSPAGPASSPPPTAPAAHR
jgi:cell division protein FtsL